MPFKTTVITGATSGIGKETALALAKKDHTLYLLVRNTDKGERLRQDIIGQTGNQNIYIVKCDLADMQSVRNAAAELGQKLTSINVLINNAGGIFDKYKRTADGFEQTFAANHLGHFLLANSLMPLLIMGQARIINTSSIAHKSARASWLNEVQFEHKAYSPFKAYALAKLLNIYFTKSLVDKYAPQGITAYALHPGVVNTGFGSSLSGFGNLLITLARPFMISAEEGAKTTIYLATQPEIEKLSGQYFIKKKPVQASAAANDITARNKLWQLSAALVNI